MNQPNNNNKMMIKLFRESLREKRFSNPWRFLKISNISIDTKNNKKEKVKILSCNISLSIDSLIYFMSINLFCVFRFSKEFTQFMNWQTNKTEKNGSLGSNHKHTMKMKMKKVEATKKKKLLRKFFLLQN